MPVEYPQMAIGGLTRADVFTAFGTAGVKTNPSAEALLASEAFDHKPAEAIKPVALSVGELGLTTRRVPSGQPRRHCGQRWAETSVSDCVRGH